MGDHSIKIVLFSVMLLMLGTGLGIDLKQLVEFARRIRIVVFGLLANFLFVPLISYICIAWLPVSADIKIGIMLMAAAPIAPMAPAPFVQMAHGDIVYSLGLMVLAAILSILFTPLILSYSIPASVGGVSLDPIQIVKTLLAAQLVPIAIGMAVRRLRPNCAEKLVKVLPRIGQIGLVVGVALLLTQQASQMLLIGLFPCVVMIVLIVLSLMVGDWTLIGEDQTKRRSLAVSTAIRNVPLAILIAGQNFPGTVVAPTVLAFSVLMMALSLMYGRITTRREISQ